VTGPEEAQVALFRATAGIWEAGRGRVVRPPAEEIMFLPERPYLPPGSLREVLVRTGQEGRVSHEDVMSVLRALELEPALARARGLDAECDWDDVLSLSEQQLIAVARIFLAAPAFAVLQSPRTTLDANQTARVFALLSAASITTVTFGRVDDAPGAHDAVLELRPRGAWSWKPSSAPGTA
jgi:putative ATP-binding cassette transporter